MQRTTIFVTVDGGRPIALDATDDGLASPSQTAVLLARWCAHNGRRARVDALTQDGSTVLVAKALLPGEQA